MDGLVQFGWYSVSIAPAVFVGGAQEMPVGYTAYFECDLEPSDYALVAEIPNGRHKIFAIE